VKWTAIEEASSEFERPAWAIHKMVAEGSLEKRVEKDGRVFVRRPPTLDDIASELAPFLPDEVVPVVATVEADEPEAATAALAEPSREEMMLRALWKMLERQNSQIAEIRRLAEAPRLLPAPPPPPPPPPAPPPSAPAPVKARAPFFAVVAVLIVLGAAGSGFAWFAQESLERQDRALEQSQWLATKILEAQTAPAGSGSGTLAAGFKR
jgi:hypothetical protein